MEDMRGRAALWLQYGSREARPTAVAVIQARLAVMAEVKGRGQSRGRGWDGSIQGGDEVRDGHLGSCRSVSGAQKKGLGWR